ncbi:MAG: tetratricopeptide repeat protein, partial [Woeseiaceae bacterium]|nr:tetratricopeptide repeat protein [Woeseiaceae bacterium]
EDVIRRRQDVVRSGLADWKVHFELAVLYQRLRNSSAANYHLEQIIELYPHNRESYMKLAESLSKEGKWSDVIQYLEQSLYYTRGDEKKIAETTNWLGTAYLRTGDYEMATDVLLEMMDDYPDQIDLNLRAYGNLIRYAREQGKDKHLERYVRDVQRYARSLIRNGKDEDYPMLYRRMSQIMTIAGYEEEANEWADTQAQ